MHKKKTRKIREAKENFKNLSQIDVSKRFQKHEIHVQKPKENVTLKEKE